MYIQTLPHFRQDLIRTSGGSRAGQLPQRSPPLGRAGRTVRRFLRSGLIPRQSLRRWSFPRPPDICIRYDQVLVVRGKAPVPDGRQVSWLMDPRARWPSQRTSVACSPALPNHSDEIVQDFHLFPFYPLACGSPHQGHRSPMNLLRSAPLPAPELADILAEKRQDPVFAL